MKNLKLRGDHRTKDAAAFGPRLFIRQAKNLLISNMTLENPEDVARSATALPMPRKHDPGSGHNFCDTDADTRCLVAVANLLTF